MTDKKPKLASTLTPTLAKVYEALRDDLFYFDFGEESEVKQGVFPVCEDNCHCDECLETEEHEFDDGYDY